MTGTPSWALLRHYVEALPKADTTLCNGVEALGLDETLFVREGDKHTKKWATSVVDVGGGGRDARLVEVVEGGTATKVSAWIDTQDQTWRDSIRWGVRRGHFPTNEAALKVLYLVSIGQQKNRANPIGRINGWKHILNTLTIHYYDRLTAATN